MSKEIHALALAHAEKAVENLTPTPEKEDEHPVYATRRMQTHRMWMMWSHILKVLREYNA